jgi:hypothetical protein
MFRPLKKKHVRVVLLLGIALSLSLASSASAAPPVGKIYDCYSYNQLSGFDTRSRPFAAVNSPLAQVPVGGEFRRLSPPGGCRSRLAGSGCGRGVGGRDR